MASRTDERRLAEARQEMATLAEDDRWWVRLFVVYTMAATRSLYDAEVAAALREDPDPLVARIARERIRRWELERPPPPATNPADSLPDGWEMRVRPREEPSDDE